MGVAEDIVISMVVFLFLSLRNTDGTVFQGADSEGFRNLLGLYQELHGLVYRSDMDLQGFLGYHVGK